MEAEAAIRMSPTWARNLERLEDEIQRLGVERFREFGVIRENIIVGDKKYAEYAQRCGDLLYPGKSRPTIIEFGAGYGGMSDHWPSGSRFINIDIPPMLKIQNYYLKLQKRRHRAQLVPFDEIRAVNFSKRYFFAAYSLTETTPEFWEWCFEHVFPKVAGVFIRGGAGWRLDRIERWPWERLQAAFGVAHLSQVRKDPDEFELIGVRS